MPIVFYSKLSIHQCIENLKINTRKIIMGSTSLSVLFNYWNLDKKYFVQIQGNNFRLERMYIRNTYAPIFTGKFTKINNKTKIEGNLETREYTTVIFVIWFSFIILFASGVAIDTITTLIKQGHISSDRIIPTFIPFIMIVFGIYIYKAMKKQALQWKSEMIEFIEKTLQAKIEP